MTKKQKKLCFRIGAAAVLFAAVFCLEKFTALKAPVVLVCYLFPYLCVGYDVLYSSARNILHGQVFDECFLMTVATVGAFIIGEYPEAVFVMLFYQLGELFQSIAVGKSRRSIASLMDMRPEIAHVIRDGVETDVFPEEVLPGETVLIKVGERVPIDGEVLTGESDLDTKAITGESLPRFISPGDCIYSGTVNLTGVLTVKTTCKYQDCTVAEILELVENSSFNKAKSESFITKFAKYYTPAVVITAVLLAVIPSVITKAPADWIYRALIFLVVSCPCALVISIPLTFFGGIGGLASKGVLVKGGNFLEALAKTQYFVFDKTGTLTKGSFQVDQINPVSGVTKEQLIDTAALAEYGSNHPLGKAIVSASKHPQKPKSVLETAGFGVKATLDTDTVLAGKRSFLQQNGVRVSVESPEATTVFVAKNGEYIGLITLFDGVKENAAASLQALKNAGVTKTVMLTGDAQKTAKAVAGLLNIDECRYELLPRQKVEQVEALLSQKEKNKTLTYVGDGINDAPVLTRADIGIAMGALGSDAAIEAADIVIMDDDLNKLPLAVCTAKKTKRIVVQNTVFALTVKFGVLIFAAFGLTNMWIGVLADVGVAVLAILNAMRMLKEKR